MLPEMKRRRNFRLGRLGGVPVVILCLSTASAPVSAQSADQSADEAAGEVWRLVRAGGGLRSRAERRA